MSKTIAFIRHPDQIELIQKRSSSSKTIFFPLTVESEDYVENQGIDHVLFGSLLPEKECYEKIESLEATERCGGFWSWPEPAQISVYICLQLERILLLSSTAAQRLYDQFNPSCAVAFVEKPQPLGFGATVADTKDSIIEWCFLEYLRSCGVEIRVFSPKKRSKNAPLKSPAIWDKILGEFPLNRWPALAKGSLKLLFERCGILKNHQPNQGVDLWIGGGVELASQPEDASWFAPDGKSRMLCVSLGRVGDRSLHPKYASIEHVAALPLFYGFGKTKVGKTKKRLKKHFKKLLGESLFKTYKKLIYIELKSMIDEYTQLQKLYLFPIERLIKKNRPRRVMLCSPTSHIGRGVAIRARKMGIPTIAVQHGGFIYLPPLGFYECFDEVGVWGELMERNIRKSGYKGKLKTVPHSISEQGIKKTNHKKSSKIRIPVLTSILMNISLPIGGPEFRKSFEWMASALDEENVEIWLKTHPRFDHFDYYKTLQDRLGFKMFSTDTSLEDCLLESRFVFLPPKFTTAAVRAAQLRVPAIFVDPMESDTVKRRIIHESFLVAHTAEETRDLAKRLLDLDQDLIQESLSKQDNFIRRFMGAEKIDG